MEAARLNLRMQKEIKLLMVDPPSGVSFPFLSDKDNFFSSFLNIEARLTGPEETVYSGGLFTLKIQIPERYPFQPPNVTFVTPIYHPNIDNGGRICLDILNLPPKGGWKPSLNISTVMISIGLLLSDPNPDDGLMAEASREYKYNRKVFDEKARDWTRRFADPLTATKNAEDDSQLTNLMMPMQGEAKPLRTLSMDPHPDKQGGDEAEESRKKKLRLTAGKLSLSSTSSFRSISGEKSKEDKIAAAAAAEDHDNITNENFKAVEESPDIRTIIISDSEESDSEIAGSTLSLSNAAFCKR